MSERGPSPFESFNARALAPEQVAQTFVPPREQYSLVVRRAHTMVIGPRGSGKTTLLKMLQRPALEAWQHDSAEEYRDRVDFAGVFVPTDISWSGQISSLGGQNSTPELSRLFGISAFSTHVLRALATAIGYELHSGRWQGNDDRESRIVESELASAIAEAWDLSLPIASIRGLRAALTSRLTELWRLASQEGLRGEPGRAERLAAIRFLHLDFLAASAEAIDVGEAIVGPYGGRWALLFDELELAPPTIRETLLRALRSTDDRFLFKLALSPYSEDVSFFRSAEGALEGHDYDIVSLTYGHKKEALPFCEELFKSLLRHRGVADTTPAHVLGESEFESLAEHRRSTSTAYRAGSPQFRRLKRLAANDATFRSYLESKEIQLDRLGEVEGDQRAAELRKIIGIVIIRDEFRLPDDRVVGGRRIRTRKSRALYAGVPSLFEISEGNPRVLIGLFTTLLDQSHDGRFSSELQARELDRAISRYRALLRTIPLSASAAKPTRGVLGLLDDIGQALFGRIVVDDFTPDPIGSFTIDSHVDEAMLEALGKALNAGAIIYVPDERSQSDAVLGSLRGRRFRLSYLVAPYYRLPLRLDRAVSLTQLLAPGRRQPELFLEDDA